MAIWQDDGIVFAFDSKESKSKSWIWLVSIKYCFPLNAIMFDIKVPQGSVPRSEIILDTESATM